MKKLSPLRNSTQATNATELALEQLQHYGIDPQSEYGQTLNRIVCRLYENQDDLEHLWQVTIDSVNDLPQSERIGRFNAKKFLSFQLAKSLDTLQNPFRRSYQGLGYSSTTQVAKGPYAVFDNVTAIFSATPVIARTATYIYACAEWIEDAFKGQELMLEIYSRLLNPTGISLANHIVDLEAGPYAQEYFAWNFNSGMAAIDSLLAHLLGNKDILITSQNIYGGAHQLIYDWYGKSSNLEIAVESFSGFTAEDFARCFAEVKEKHADRIEAGYQVYLYLESPCNPHGTMLDVPEICRRAHEVGIRVMLDATIATPFLLRPLQRIDPQERPDFIIHSYTKDLSGTGSVIAGVVIGRNEDMFIPKGEEAGGRSWQESLFWNVYYIKGAFLNADAAFDVLQGMRTLEVRMLSKCINTNILATFLDKHPGISVNSNVLPDHPNSEVREKLSFLGLPAPLFTIDFENANVPRQAFQKFFDNLSPTFGHMISLGQSNTIVACPALTTHSELSPEDLARAEISPTMIRFAVGDEDARDLLRHLVATAQLAIDPVVPGFSEQFPSKAESNALIEQCYLESHGKYIRSKTVTA